MPTLTPVDNDPFAPPAGTGSPTLTPVDHDPFAASASPATAPNGQSAQPGGYGVLDYLHQFLVGGSPWDPNAPKKTLGTTAFWDKPADASWGDYMAAHVQPVDDAVRSATNAFGVGDRFAAGMSGLTGVGGGDLAAQRAQSAARAKADPSMTTAGNLLGYAPLAAQGIAAGLGGGVLASGAEGVAAGSLAGGGNSNAQTWGGVGKDALTGGAIGGVTGLGLGAAGKYALNPIVNWAKNKIGQMTGALATPADVTATTQAAKDAAYDKLNDVILHPSDIGNGVSDVSDGIYANDVDGSYRKNSPQTSKILNDYSNQMNDAALAKQPTTGATLNDTIKKLNGVSQRNPSNFEGVAAAQARDGLTDVFHTTTPLSTPDGFNLDTALEDAANANKAYKNADFLQKARQNLKYFGQSPGGDAASIAQKYYPSGGDDLEAGRPTQDAAAFKRLSDITLAGGGMPSGNSIAHMVYPAVEAIGSGIGAALGGPTGAMIGEMGGGLAGAGVKTALSNAMTAAQRRAMQSALTAGYPDLTGQSTRFPPVDMSPAIRAIMFGAASPYIRPK